MAAPYPNELVEEDENGIEDSSRLFTTAARDLLGGARKGLRSFFRYKRRIQPVMVVGRNVATNTQTIDPLFDVNGLIPTTGGYLSDSPISSTVPTDFTALEVGEWDFIASIIRAGNATATIPSAATTDGRLFEIHQILTTLIAVGVATRTMTLLAQTGMPAAGVMTTDDDFAVTAGPSITDAQQGRIFVPRAPGLVQLNDNGTITTSDISPLPIQCGDAGVFESVITAGLAADSHRIALVVRRVA